MKEIKGDKNVVSVDAKQRAILAAVATQEVEGGKVQVMRFCSEPSPDVYSVIAQALSAGGSFSKSAEPASMQAALNMAFSSAEQGTTIPRTQTINMLRELMYRTCERYLNHGYDEQELSVQAVRDQRLMVSILAIEQLTGAVTPKPVSIGATASAAQNGAEAVVRLDDARKELDASRTALTNAQEAYDEQNSDSICEKIDKAINKDKLKLEDLPEDQQAAEPDCTKKTIALASAKKRIAEATQHHADLQRLGAGTGGTTATQTTGPGEGGLSHVDTSGLERVSEMVREIVSDNFHDSTEVMLFCLRNIRNEAGTISKSALKTEDVDDLKAMCVDFFKKLIDAGTSKYEADAAMNIEAAESAANMSSVTSDLFDRAWPTLSREIADSAEKNRLVSRLKTWLTSSDQSKAGCFAKATDRASTKICFDSLPAPVKRRLSVR